MFGQLPLHGQVADDSGAQATPIRGRCLCSGAGWAQGHCLPGGELFPAGTHLITTPLIGQLLINPHHVAGIQPAVRMGGPEGNLWGTQIQPLHFVGGEAKAQKEQRELHGASEGSWPSSI